MSSYYLYGVEFKDVTPREALQKMICALKSNKRMIIFTPNLTFMRAVSDDRRLAGLLDRADLLLPDGVGISVLARKECRRRVTPIPGIDAAYALLRYAAQNGYSVYLLGAKQGIAKRAAENLCRELPTLHVCGTHHGYFDLSVESDENKAVVQHIGDCSPDILLVCMGFPLQESWICENANSLSYVKIFMGIGGSLDVWSGRLPRAPRFVQKMRLEWLWRCLLEPRRLPSLIKDSIRVFSPAFLLKKESRRKKPKRG